MNSEMRLTRRYIIRRLINIPPRTEDMRRYSRRIRFSWEFYQGRNVIRNLTFQLTHRCNHRCGHCYVINTCENNRIPYNELNTSDLKKLLREACSLGCMFITFTGGEPLLRDDFEELYVYARRLGLGIFLQTNATLITPRLAKLFSQLSPNGPVRATLYGMSEETYMEATAVGGSFD